MPNSIDVILHKEKETKGTWRYEEEGDAPMIGTLYLKKLALKAAFDAPPEKIRVQVEAL